MNSFKKINLSLGWITFLISAMVYYITMEPSVSLWDCGEFIATSYKMQIGHPPGAPLFMMINRFFSLFASDVSEVAAMINFASVLASALTIMFLYWTIAHMALKLIDKNRETATPKDSLIVYGAAFIGAMSYAFTDTFWFSAVEGEVYAQSSLFTAMVFWAMLKWENESNEATSSRWLILIAYIMGLSIGVHLLNLLTIPALVMIYYYKKYPNKSKFGWWKAFGFSILLLGTVLFVIIPKTIELGAWTDKLFVNSFGFEKNIGFVFFLMLFMGLIAYGVYLSHKRKKVIINTILICLGVLLVGYGTYASVIIRSSANPPMNSNHPDNAYALLRFLNREQYGKAPLTSGEYYSSIPIDYTEKKVFNYDKKEKKYNETTELDNYVFAPSTTSIFPRMHSMQHAEQYKNWVDIQGKRVTIGDKTVIIPTFAENIEFFFKYQVNYMYWRYFLWNFVGRQNDIQGIGDTMHGNWISGINFIDEMYLGPQDNLPQELENNKARNTYFFLPFLLGLAGIVYQLSKNKGDFVVTSLLFFMTGLAILLYINQHPNQVRERDYAYAGSFYAFSIWIGLGVFWVQSIINKIIKNHKIATLAAIAISMSVPTILIAQNWDDHDRSNRYIARDWGKNYLYTTLPNSILFAYGDNDTFGPWYAQEVENVRPDVRICNLSYMQSNWYAIQMANSTFNESKPIEFTIPQSVYGNEEHNDLEIVELQNGYININSVLNFIAIDSQGKRNIFKQIGVPEGKEIFPAKKIAIPVNKKNALKAGIITESDLPNVVDTIFIDINKNALGRHEYLFLDMLATSDWSRPIYLTQTSHVVGQLGLSKYFQFDGLAYKLVPIKTEETMLSNGKIDTEYLYGKVMNEYAYGNISDTTVNLDVFSIDNVRSARHIFSRLSIELSLKGETEKARNVIEKSLIEIPFSQVGHDYYSAGTIKALYLAGKEEEAKMLLNDAVNYCMDYLNYFSQFDNQSRYYIDNELQRIIHVIYLLVGELNQYEALEKELAPIKPYANI